MFLQVPHVVIDIKELNSLVDVLLDIFGELLKNINKVGKIDGGLANRFACATCLLSLLSNLSHLLLDHLLVLGVLLLDMVEQVSKQNLVVHDKFIDDRSVDILRWELIRVTFFYHLGHFGKVL